MDVPPDTPTGRQVIESYGDGRFRVSGQVFEGSILVFTDRARSWPVVGMETVSLESLAAVVQAEPVVEVLLLGCGDQMALVPKALREGLRADGVVIEPMDTGAACRTFNLLMAEGRRVAAALIAVD
jgi:uncharacterized protein